MLKSLIAILTFNKNLNRAKFATEPGLLGYIDEAVIFAGRFSSIGEY